MTDPSRRDLLRRAGTVAALTAAATRTGTAYAATDPADPADLSVLEALAAMRSRSLSPSELLTACIDRVEGLDPVLMAFLARTDATAKARAKVSDGRWLRGTARLLEGLPYGAKDIFYTKGVHTTAAAAAFKDFIPSTDATLVSRLDAAGAVMLGKLNTHEFAFGASTPPTRNPWDTARHPGGSSGGTGSAVGGHLLPMGTGSDTIGSLRIPSASCGIVGIRPTFGITSRHDVVPLSFSFDTTGMLARTVADAAFLFGFVVARDPKDASTENAVSGQYPTAAPANLRGVRLGRPDRWFFDGVNADVLVQVERSLTAAKDLGAHIVDVTLPAVFDDVMDPSAAASYVTDADLASELLGEALSLPTLVAYTEAAGFHYKLRRDNPAGYSYDIQAVLQLAETVTAASYLRAQQLRSVFVTEMAAVFTSNRIDALVAPTLQAPPGNQQAIPGYSGLLNGSGAAHNNTPWSFNGFPSLSLPVGLDSVGMPASLQLNGLPHTESALFSIALAIETSMDFRRHTPTILSMPQKGS